MSIGAIVGVYAALAAAWIVVSDLVVSGRVQASDPGTGFDGASWNITKGLVFVAATAVLLHRLLIRRQRLLDAERSRSTYLARQLAEAERMEALGRLAGGVAHDFNNLLTVIRGNVELARTEADPDARTSLDAIEEAAARATELTGELQIVARRHRMDLRHLDLCDVLRRNRTVLAAMLPPSVSVVVRCPDRDVVVELDEPRFQQVLLNLAGNARDAMPDGGEIAFSLDVEADTAVLAVSDNGHGMTADEARHCFEPFFTTKPDGVGTGLGLSLTYGVVHQSSGTIDVRSELGQGTTFEIRLPLVALDAPAPRR